MKNSRVKRRWAEGKPVLATVSHFHDPQSAELIGRMGIDCLWIDLEHQALGINQFENMVRAAHVAGMDVMGRAAKGEFARMARLLDAGANLVMYPRCETAEEARQVVRSAKYPPFGQRGIFPPSPATPYCLTPIDEYLRQANEEVIVMVQVESPNAAKQARDMAEVDGIDMIFFGPGDFSLAAGVPLQLNAPVVRDAMKQTAVDAISAGKRFGAYVNDMDGAKFALDIGATLISYGSDQNFVRSGLADLREQFTPMGIAFGDIYT